MRASLIVAPVLYIPKELIPSIFEASRDSFVCTGIKRGLFYCAQIANDKLLITVQRWRSYPVDVSSDGWE